MKYSFKISGTVEAESEKDAVRKIDRICNSAETGDFEDMNLDSGPDEEEVIEDDDETQAT